MADLTGYFFDTSVLAAGIIEIAGPGHPAQRLLAAVAGGRFVRPATAWHCCLEFYSVATRLPRELRVTPQVAAMLVEEEVMARFVVYSLPRDRRLGFVAGAAHDSIAGGRIYDAHIAEIARSCGADVVVTENRKHFTQLLRYGVRVLTAEEAAVAL
jgi:predicted nucleic acid-binding protein